MDRIAVVRGALSGRALVLGGALCALLGASGAASAEPLGERAGALVSPELFPNWRERAVHVLVNRARVDPQAALAQCPAERCAEKACYGPVAPMAWDLELNRAARFHAENLTRAGAGLQHDSPCTLRADVGASYPDSCDGSPECACEGGSASCGAEGCTDFGARLGLFGALRGASGENAAPNGDPEDIFGLWLYEPDGGAECGWRTTNGHRFNLLSPNYGSLGVGAAGNYMVQDFGAGGRQAPLAAGIHFPERPSGEATFLTTWHRPQGGGARQVRVVVDGQCHELALEHGQATSGAWRAEVGLERGCHAYFFWGSDERGEARYPEDGSLLVGVGQACEGLYSEQQANAPCLGEQPSDNNGANNGANNTNNGANNADNNSANNADNSGSNSGTNNAGNSGDPNNANNPSGNNGGSNSGSNNGGQWANNEGGGGADGFVDDQRDGFVDDEAPQGESARGLCAVDRKSEASQGALPLGGLALLALALRRRRR